MEPRGLSDGEEIASAFSVAGRVCLAALCWIAFATSKSRTFSALIQEQSYPVWSLVLTGERGEMRLVPHILEVRGEEERRGGKEETKMR